MDKLTFEQQITKLKKDYQSFKKYLGFMVFANVILSFGLVYSIFHERVVMSPVMAPEYKMMVTNNKASPEYLNLLSRNILDLLLNITPNNVLAQQNELMSMVDSKYRDELQSKLMDIASQVRTNNLSQSFYVQTIKIINKDNVIYVIGTLNQYIDKNINSSRRVNYKLTFIINNYIPKIAGIEQLADNDPQMKELR